MKFRPCIDIHNGKVKQIVGSTLLDEGAGPAENFVSDQIPAYYAQLYRQDNLTGGHIINLNKMGTPEYEATRSAAMQALAAFPGGMQIGGGINAENAADYIAAGASHVVVTSYVFNNGRVDYAALERLSGIVGPDHLVLDLSCKNIDGKYMVVTDRWQNVTDEQITFDFLDKLAQYCDEFLVHAADVEGKKGGIDADLVQLLSKYTRIPITYAGGISDYSDIDLIDELSGGNLDFTIGSALDLFGGRLSYERIVKKVSNMH